MFMLGEWMMARASLHWTSAMGAADGPATMSPTQGEAARGAATLSFQGASQAQRGGAPPEGDARTGERQDRAVGAQVASTRLSPSLCLVGGSRRGRTTTATMKTKTKTKTNDFDEDDDYGDRNQ